MSLQHFVMGVIGFASGIIFRSLFVFSWSCIFFPVLLAIALTIIGFRRRKKIYILFALALLAMSLGMARVAITPVALPEELAANVGTKISLEGVVYGDPDLRESTQRITIQTEETRILAVAGLHPDFRHGELVRVRGVLELPQPFATDGGREFKYDKFLAKDGIFGVISFAEITSVDDPSVFANGRGMLFGLKHTFIKGLELALPEPYAALASGLITGGKQGLGKPLLDAFIAAGLIHIVVLSGYNVMIVAEAVLRALTFLPKRTATMVAGATIFLFVLAAGAGAASIRAGLMAGIALYARASGRTYDALRAMVLAGMIMLLINPLLLVYDPGFQLSFVATAGLILGAPLIERRLVFIQRRFIRELISATLAAQIAVLPLLLFQTGRLSLIALPANLVVLPAVPLAMLFSSIAGLVAVLVPSIAPFIGLPAFALLAYIVTVAEIAAALPFSQILIPSFPFWIVVVVYGFLVFSIRRVKYQTT